MISAVFSLFSGGLRGGSVYIESSAPLRAQMDARMDSLVLVKVTYQQDVVVLRLGSQVFEDGLLPKSLHMIPILYHSMSDRIMQ